MGAGEQTSTSSPIRVDFLVSEAIPGSGRLGLTFAPGKKDAGKWARDLDADLAELKERFGATLLVSLMEEHEYARLGIADLVERAEASGIEVKWLPIRDVSVPAPARAAEFRTLVAEVVKAVERGEIVVVHCRGGLGRSGLLAACALVHCGAPPGEAIAAVRAARPGAIETREQERWVEAYARREVPAKARSRRPGKRSSDRKATTEPTDADIEERLRAVPANRWRALWTAVDALPAGEKPAVWRGGNQIGTRVVDGSERPVFQMPYPEYSEAVDRVLDALHALDIIVPFNWPEWDGTGRYRGGRALDEAPVADAVRMMTAIIRAERFSEGTIAAAVEDGTLAAALRCLRRWYDAKLASR